MRHPTAHEFSLLRRARYAAFGNHRPMRRSADTYQRHLWLAALSRVLHKR